MSAQVVHYDNGTKFCEAADQSGLLTRNEDEVTCGPCKERLAGIDAFLGLQRKRRVMDEIDWFGEGR